jgi:hypothetical protein
MKISLRGHKVKVVIALVMVAVLLAVLARTSGLVFYDRYARTISRNLSNALEGARSVVLVEHTAGIEIARRIATPDEISRLRRVISVWPRPFIREAYLCWVPHHSIEIVRVDGSQVNADVCFVCGKFTIEDVPFVAPLPPYLAKPLASFFASVGMAPKSDDEYASIELSHRQESDNAQNDSNK